MKILRSIRVIALTASLWTGLAHAGPAPAEAQTLFGQIMAAKARMSEIQAEQSGATADLRQKLNAVSDSISLISRLPLSEERIKQMQSNLAEAKARVASLENQLEVAKITDPAAQAAKKTELAAMQTQLRNDLKTAATPFEEKIQNAHKPIEAVGTEWAQALDGFFRTPAGEKFAGISKDKVIWNRNDTGQLSWKDATGKQVCWASIFLDETPAKIYSGQKTLDGKYGMNIHGSENIWVFCGYLKIAMSINKPEWKVNDQTAIDLFKALVDVDGLGSLKPSP